MSKTLVCRCEDVTLHELETALERGHRDIESVKRYTGFGTGWCQGKWCQALCARLIVERGGEASQPFTARPPYRPVTFGALAGMARLDLRTCAPSAGGEPRSEDRPGDPADLSAGEER